MKTDLAVVGWESMACIRDKWRGGTRRSEWLVALYKTSGCFSTSWTTSSFCGRNIRQL
jgi:hypothetical protein